VAQVLRLLLVQVVTQAKTAQRHHSSVRQTAAVSVLAVELSWYLTAALVVQAVAVVRQAAQVAQVFQAKGTAVQQPRKAAVVAVQAQRQLVAQVAQVAATTTPGQALPIRQAVTQQARRLGLQTQVTAVKAAEAEQAR